GQIVQKIRDFFGEMAILLKNESSMVYHRSHIHQLARGLKKYLDDRKQFPAGTSNRGPRGLTNRPDERIAWTRELLPYIDSSFDDLKIDENRSWKDGDDNVHAAGMAIPYYLAADPPEATTKTYPLGSWRHVVPGLRSPVAAIHFVGVAGVGLDAAEYR